MRLHANLLFYGLDQGTWSDPPSGSNGSGGWTKSPWASDENEQAASENRTPSTAVGGSVSFGNEQSTDEGSEAKGSESDSLPDSSEGYLVSNQQFSAAGPTMLPYMSTNAVPSHTAPQQEATPVYNSYLSPGSFLSIPGFGGSDAANHYSYDVGTSMNQNQYTYDVGPSVTNSGVTPSVMEAVGIPPGAENMTTSPDGVPSIGSYAHLSGQCSRCCFHPKGRCANGYSCEFCHYDHDKRPRNGKKKRYRRQLDGSTIEEVDGMTFLVPGLE
jgi:hypothetical protein